MASEIPVVRYFVACRSLKLSDDNAQASIYDLVHSVILRQGEQFPTRQTLALYALFSNGRGTHRIRLQLTRMESGHEHVLVTSPGRMIDFGQDPTVVFGLPILQVNVDFTQQGQYALNLLCNDHPEPIARVYLDVRVTP